MTLFPDLLHTRQLIPLKLVCDGESAQPSQECLFHDSPISAAPGGSARPPGTNTFLSKVFLLGKAKSVVAYFLLSLNEILLTLNFCV